jgi:hypothetical protein
VRSNKSLLKRVQKCKGEIDRVGKEGYEPFLVKVV